MKKQLITSVIVLLIAIILVQNAEIFGAKKILSAITLQTSNQSKDKGIGPVKNITLAPIDQKLVNEGKTIFTGKCTVCHSLDKKIIGPPLRNVTKTRTPEYIMNMILNPTNMEKEDPVTKELHKQYVATPMTNQNFTQDQARSLLEYLRSVVK